jgi:hypothetical protein
MRRATTSSNVSPGEGLEQESESRMRDTIDQQNDASPNAR